MAWQAASAASVSFNMGVNNANEMWNSSDQWHVHFAPHHLQTLHLWKKTMFNCVQLLNTCSFYRTLEMWTQFQSCIHLETRSFDVRFATGRPKPHAASRPVPPSSQLVSPNPGSQQCSKVRKPKQNFMENQKRNKKNIQISGRVNIKQTLYKNGWNIV